MADKKTVKGLLDDEIKDLYSAEKQLTRVIPKMAKGSNDPALQAGFKNHLKETESQAARLEEVAKLLEMKPSGKKCVGMEGCIKEGGAAVSVTLNGAAIQPLYAGHPLDRLRGCCK